MRVTFDSVGMDVSYGEAVGGRVRLGVLFLLVGCGDGPDSPDPSDPPSETEEPRAAWTSGPALPDCTAQAGSSSRVALSGVVLAPEGAVAGAVVYDRETERITCVGDCDLSGAEVVCTEGVISPALIDAHDHLQYNLLGPWDHGDRLYSSRYEWQSDGRYWDFRESWDDVWDSGAYDCEIHKWAEARQLVSGVTSAVGGDIPSSGCSDTLLRNLDEGIHNLDYDLDYKSGRPEYQDEGDADSLASRIASGDIGASVQHVAEGVGGSVRWEISHMEEIGAYGPGFAFVHATDVTTEQLAWMASTGTGIVWSPRSNLDLYYETTPIDVAIALGVPVAIGPDWTYSGSAHVTQELSCAYDWLSLRNSAVTDADLVNMATSDAARLLGLDEELGTLSVGARADIAVYTWEAEPYRAVVRATPDDTRLVIRDGKALYGEASMVSLLAEEPSWCETVTACAVERSICVREAASGEAAQTLSEIESLLASALDDELFPIFVCEDTRGTCADVLPVPTDEDPDGDGITDDVCPGAYDPNQRDHDGDGLGDACDPCILSAEETCSSEVGDIDGDGIADTADTCPWLANPAQTDSDGDKKGDACDTCPDLANPGDEICPPTVDVLRNPNHPDHPPVGVDVTLTGLVVTAVRDNQFVAQDPDLDAWAGIVVFTDSSPAVSVGDEVTVSGTYEEFYGASQIEDPTVSITGTGSIAPLVVGSCSVGTGGANAEKYESMLITVEEVTVSNQNPDSPNDYGEFEVEDCLRVDDLYCASCWSSQPSEGTSFSAITGPLSYTFSNAKLTPREPADLQ